MKKNISIFTLVVVIFIGLSACSKIPSETDAKVTLIKNIGIANCKDVILTSFEKINSIPGADQNRYTVLIKYSVSLAPKTEELKIITRSLNLEVGKIEEDYNQSEKIIMDSTKIPLKNPNVIFDNRNILALIALNAKIEENSIKKKKALDTFNDKYLQVYSTGCKNIKNFREQMVSGDQKYSKIRNYETSINMIHTENGWE